MGLARSLVSGDLRGQPSNFLLKCAALSEFDRVRMVAKSPPLRQNMEMARGRAGY
jgi:hypothetical protein